MIEIKRQNNSRIFLIVLFVNFLLFSAKLYIGLSSNSISIYSDGINNLFDGLSALAGVLGFYALSKSRDLSFESRSIKTEQLLSFVLSAIILVTGAVFLINSIERLMYPAPVWFTVSYFYIIAATAVIKLVLFLFLRGYSKKNGSSVLRVISLDSLTDFFITAVSLITLLASYKGGYAFDACGGIAVSSFVLFSGARSLKESLTRLIGASSVVLRKKAEEILSEYISADSRLEFSFSAEKRLIFKTDVPVDREQAERLKEKIKEETDFNLYFIN